MSELKEVLLAEIPGFNDLGHKFLNGEINMMEFKKASGGMGVYAHRNKKEFVIRLKLHSGVLSKEKLRVVYDFAKKYNLSGIHLTTRQSIQLHGLSIDEVCEIMREAMDYDIYTRGAGGNYPRNVALSPLSGVDPEEAFDVTPYALAVNKHFEKKIYTYKLPRKIKVSFSNTAEDFSHATITDLGFYAVNKDGEKLFKVYIGGGMGRNASLGVEYDELIKPEEVLYHVEGLTKLFIDEGDYKNHAKARIRYIVQRMGKEEFLNCYKRYLKAEKENSKLDLNAAHIEYNKKGIETDVVDNRLFKQKQSGLYSVYVHPIGGQLSIEDFELILSELDKTVDPEVRLAMTEGFYIRNLDGKEAEHWLKITANISGKTRLEQSVACIGVPTCQIGIQNGQETLHKIVQIFKDNNFTEDVLPVVHISGCGNSCGVHEIGEIGLVGKVKRVNGEVKDAFELFVDGKLGVGKSALGRSCGDILREQVPEFLFELAKLVKESHSDFNEWLENNEEQFKEFANGYLV